MKKIQNTNSNKILNSTQLRELEQQIKSECLDINGSQDISINDRALRFKQSKLSEFREQVESTTCQTNIEDIANINQFNKLLTDNPTLLREIITTLLNVQSELLKERDIESGKLKREIHHLESITYLAEKSFPENKFLLLIVTVHDSFKHISDAHVELALHELASAQFGSKLIVEALKKIAQKHRIEPEIVKSIEKISARAVYTHGSQEFPENMSINHKVGKTEDRLFNLFGKIYPGTKKRATPKWFRNKNDTSVLSDQKDKPNIITESIAATNACDMIIGSDLESLDKYNLTNKIEDKLQLSTFEDYLKTNLFNSFYNNLNGYSVKLFELKDKKHPIKNNINHYIDTKKLIISLFNPEKQKEVLQTKEQQSTEIYDAVSLALKAQKQFLLMKKRQGEVGNKNIGNDNELKDLNLTLNKLFSKFIAKVKAFNKSKDIV